MRTGILGGTFDPIHIAHLHAAETAMDQLALDRVLFMPAGDPWQKEDRVITPGLVRLEMVRAAVAGVRGFAADDRELTRTGPTYTVDTLAGFAAEEELVLIVGADAAAALPTWHRWTEVVERARLAVAPRPGVSSDEVAAVLPGDGVMLDMTMLEVSSTLIRTLAAEGRAFRFLVPPGVFEVIRDHRLYTEGDGGDRVGGPRDQEGRP